MKKILFIVLVVSFGLVNAQENSDKTFSYAGLGLGQSTMDYGSLSSTESADEKDTVWKVFYGVPLHKNFAIEFEYNNLGEFSFDDSSLSAESTTEHQSAGISAILKGMVTPRIQLFAKLGVHRWNMDTSIQVSTSTANKDENGTDLFYGIGANFDIGSNFFARVEYEIFKFDVYSQLTADDATLTIDGGDVGLISASLIYKF